MIKEQAGFYPANQKLVRTGTTRITYGDGGFTQRDGGSSAGEGSIYLTP